MRQQLAKLTVFSALFAISWGLMLNVPAQGATFSFTQKGFSGEPFISGAFSGEDVDRDNRLALNELSDFEALLVPSSVSFSLDNLFFFEYILGTGNSIYFEVERRIEVFNEFADEELYLLAVNGFASFSFLAIEFYLDEQLIAIADGASNQPVVVRQSVASVLEPSSSGALLLLIGLGSAKRLLKSLFLN